MLIATESTVLRIWYSSRNCALTKSLTAGRSNIQQDPSSVHSHSSGRQRNMKIGNTRKQAGKE
jgi:hypothetical protein